MNYVKIYKGKNFQLKYRVNDDRSSKPKKVIAFDMDETLGSFTDLEILWSTIIELQYSNIDKTTLYVTPDNLKLFNTFLDLYPEFLRYGILHILKYIYQKKCEEMLKRL